MTDSETIQRPGKRERLVEAARDLFHRHGVERTSLADIAKAADVPLGNVYYYFKAKDDIIRAVIDAHANQMRAALTTFDRHRNPRTRLITFIREVAGSSEVVARYGCPHGTLCAELDKRDDELPEAAATLMRLRVDWAREQFRLMGRKDAHELALTLVGGLQGAMDLANAYHDPTIVTGQTRRLQRWINNLT
jgi:TetR/AcrR family transcriptional regulator, transcriptional repressor for nem operon